MHDADRMQVSESSCDVDRNIEPLSNRQSALWIAVSSSRGHSKKIVQRALGSLHHQARWVLLIGRLDGSEELDDVRMSNSLHDAELLHDELHVVLAHQHVVEHLDGH